MIYSAYKFTLTKQYLSWMAALGAIVWYTPRSIILPRPIWCSAPHAFGASYELYLGHTHQICNVASMQLLGMTTLHSVYQNYSGCTEKITPYVF